MTDALELLSTRSSFKAVDLKAPGPSAAEIDKLLSIACRVPDHGKLAPWRFIVFEDEARFAAGDAIATGFRARFPDAKPENVEFERRRLAHAPWSSLWLVAPALTRKFRNGSKCYPPAPLL
jgi:nitroreductase